MPLRRMAGCPFDDIRQPARISAFCRWQRVTADLGGECPGSVCSANFERVDRWSLLLFSLLVATNLGRIIASMDPFLSSNHTFFERVIKRPFLERSKHILHSGEANRNSKRPAKAYDNTERRLPMYRV